jgi:hypothetical protein
MATADAKSPRLRMRARPIRVWRLTCKRHTIGIGIKANIKSVAIFTDELKTPMFLKMSEL